MINKIFCLISFCLLTFDQQAASQTFQRTYGSTSSDQGYKIILTQDNNYAVVGTNGGFSGGLYLIKVDSTGTSMWQKTFHTSTALYFNYAPSFQETQDSGFIITGIIGYSSGNGSDILLIKTNSTGDTLWSKVYAGPTFPYYFAYSYDIIITSDGGYAIIGSEGPSFGGRNIFLIKTDSSGNMQWSKSYGGTSDDEGYSLKQTSDGGFIIAGYTYSFGQGSADMYLLKVGSTGNLQWTKTYGSNSYEYANHVEITNDSGFILTGASGYTTDLFLMKTDSAGNIIWNYTYGGNSYEIGTSVRQTSDGGFIATGYTYSSGAGQSDVYLLKTDSGGNVLWSKTFGGASAEQGNDVIQHGDNYFIAGTSRNFSKGLEDVYLIKADSLGNDTCKHDTAITVKTLMPWIQGTGGTENSGFTVKSAIIVLGTPDSASYNPCVCVPPVANFASSFTDACGLFFDYSTWANTWYWDFGDGDTSTAENPNHCFPNGWWHVCLIVSNECGTDTFCDSIFASVGIKEIQKNRIKLFIAPNPFDNYTKVKFENTRNQNLQLFLVNPLGQTTMQIDNIRGNEIQIERNGLASGLYFILLIRDGEIIGTDKLMIP